MNEQTLLIIGVSILMIALIFFIIAITRRSSGKIIRTCYKCNKRVWFFQKQGKSIELTPDMIQLSHLNCKKRKKTNQND